MFFFLFYLCLDLCSFEEINYVKNWDDDFLFYFDFSLNPLIPKEISDASKIKLVSMLSECISNPKTFIYIDNLCEAIKHYKANKNGNTVLASKNLIEHMKKFSNIFFGIKYKFYKDVLKELQEIIKNKIEDKKKLNGNKGSEIIDCIEGSNRPAWYLTVGSYKLNIKYNKTVDLSENKFDFKIHFYGEDLWDFEPKECNTENMISKFNCFLENILEEYAPNLIVGEGKKYNIFYSFYENITIKTKDAIITCSAGQYLSNNKCINCNAGTYSK